MTKATEIKPGMAIEQDGQLFLVVKTEHVKPGKGGAFAQLKLKNLKTGQNIEKRYRSSEDIAETSLDRREIEYLYTDADGAIFMDLDSFDQFTLPQDLLGDALLFVKPNTTIGGLFHGSAAVSLDLPVTVDLEVTDTPPGIKNATATNQLKEATLETGLKTRVPAFINIGERIRVSTETGEYMSRV